MLVQIANVDKPQLLCALFNNAKIVTGIDPKNSPQMKISEAKQLWLKCQRTKNYRFNFIGHRVLEVDLAALSRLDVTEYERINRVSVNDIIADLRSNRQTYNNWDYVPALSESMEELHSKVRMESVQDSPSHVPPKRKIKTVDISGLDKAVVLAALYNHAPPKRKEMTLHEANQLIERARRNFRGTGTLYFGIILGKCISTNLFGDEIVADGYEKANEQNVTTIIRKIRSELDKSFGDDNFKSMHAAIQGHLNATRGGPSR